MLVFVALLFNTLSLKMCNGLLKHSACAKKTPQIDVLIQVCKCAGAKSGKGENLTLYFGKNSASAERTKTALLGPLGGTGEGAAAI